MTDPNSTIPEHVKPALWRRYEDWRVRRYEKSCARNAHRWPKLRNQRAFRRLVGVASAFVVLVLVGAVMASFGVAWFFIAWGPGLAGVAISLHVIRTVTRSVADAPTGALDEIQLAQRNSARSLGYWATFALVFIPYFVLIWMGSTMDYVRGATVYGIGVLLVSLLVAAGAIPPLLTAWWADDPDPEDLIDAMPENTTEIDKPDANTSRPAQSASTSPPEILTPTTASSEIDPPTPAPW